MIDLMIHDDTTHDKGMVIELSCIYFDSDFIRHRRVSMTVSNST